MNQNIETADVYRKLFNPQSIVIIGASNDISKPGGRIIKNITEHGYQGSILAVNPGTPSVMNLPTYKTIDELPKIPDLAIIAIPARFVVNTVEELEKKR